MPTQYKDGLAKKSDNSGMLSYEELNYPSVELWGLCDHLSGAHNRQDAKGDRIRNL